MNQFLFYEMGIYEQKNAVVVVVVFLFSYPYLGRLNIIFIRGARWVPLPQPTRHSRWIFEGLAALWRHEVQAVEGSYRRTRGGKRGESSFYALRFAEEQKLFFFWIDDS